MKNSKKPVIIIIHIVLLCTVSTLFIISAAFRIDSADLAAIQQITSVSASVSGSAEKEVILPYSFSRLQPRTPVTLTAVISPSANDVVYIKSVYSPAKIYADNKLIYEFGIRENYPGFMLDPATEVHLIELNGDGTETELRMEFLSPVSRSVLTVSPPVMGTQKAVLFYLEHHTRLSFVFSVIQLVLGAALVIISFSVLPIDKKGIVFLWLGLFSAATGIWSFGENNFTGLLIKNPTFLYLLAFTGLFTFIMPLLEFSRLFVGFKNQKPIWIAEIFFAVCVETALLLQLLGIVSCSKSMYFFHAALPLALLILAVLTFYEYFKYKNVNAKRFMVPAAVLAVSAFLELINYQIRLSDILSSIFQTGILFFLLAMGITAGFYLKDSMDLNNRQKELAFEKSMIAMQIEDQKNRGLLLAQNERLLSEKRHDLRHHLAVIQELAETDNAKLHEYLNGLISSIPQAKKHFCENQSVNAVVSHYSSVCAENGISFSVKLAVPDKNEHIPDSDLCVIFGNLLENAVEACCRMKTGERFIVLKSTLLHGLLTVTMDNSFGGSAPINTEGKFRSSKRNDFGIGLESVKSVAESAHGGTEFKSSGSVFYSSVYLRL